MVESPGQVHRCDVLVIGGGLAGAWAALRASDFTDDVILLEKARVARSGAARFCAGVMLAPVAGDDLDVWMEEMVRRGEYINDQDWVKVLLEDQTRRLGDLIAWGLPVERDGQGNLLRIEGRGHVRTKLIPFPGPKLMELLRQQVLQRKIQLRERLMGLDLLTSDGRQPTRGRVTGAVALDTRSGEFHIFRAGAVVIATNSMGGRGTMFTDNLMGDGVAMAFRAGAGLHGMEFAGPRIGWCFDRRYKIMGMNMFQHAGAFLVNRLGERIMERYDPELKDRTRQIEISQAIGKEGVEGRGPVYMDMTGIAPEKWEQFRRVIPTAMKIFEALKPWQNRVIFDVGASGIWSNCSGVMHNLCCETGIPGLYVAGQAGGFLAHGTYSVGGVNLAVTNVTGYRAGEYAAKYAKYTGQPEIDADQVVRFKEAALAPLGIKQGITADEADRRLKEILHPAANSLFRHERRMRRMLDELAGVRCDLEQAVAGDPHELVKVHETRGYALLAELIYRASLERTESRSWNLREDYPYRDDVNWLKRVILSRRGDDGVDISLEPIPIYRYPVRPARLERVPPKVMPPRFESQGVLRITE